METEKHNHRTNNEWFSLYKQGAVRFGLLPFWYLLHDGQFCLDCSVGFCGGVACKVDIQVQSHRLACQILRHIAFEADAEGAVFVVINFENNLANCAAAKASAATPTCHDVILLIYIASSM